jgi:hypothetical protein
MSVESTQVDIIRDLGRLEGRVTQLAETVDRNRASATEGLATLSAKIDASIEKTERLVKEGIDKNSETTKEIIAKMNEFSLDKAQVQGAWKIAAWFGGIMVVVGGFIATAVKYFWS